MLSAIWTNPPSSSGKGAVASAEQFIERVASQSSMSGQAYQVKCGSQAPVASGQWLRTELQGVRAGAKN